jgi:hypothetical protein
MPMTLKLKDYIHLMGQKGISAGEAEKHFKRIEIMMAKFNAVPANASLGTFGPVDVGQGICWWDFGMLKLYQKNVLLMSEHTSEAALMRSFFNLDGSSQSRVKGSNITNTTVDGASLVSTSQVGCNSDSGLSGSIKNSVLCNVRCRYIDADGCILINVTADKIIARPGSIIYNVVDDSESGLNLTDGQVLTGVFSDNGDQLVMKSSVSVDGGKAWEKKLEWNPYSFEEVYNMNANGKILLFLSPIAELTILFLYIS